VSCYTLIEAQRTSFPIPLMCRILGVSRSGYYAWRERPPSKRVRAEEALTERISRAHRNSRGTYGAPRVHAQLRAEGVRCSRKRVARLMRDAGLQGCHRRRRRSLTRRDSGLAPAPDLVERDFARKAPDELWVADISYVPSKEGFVYLAAVMDAYSRRGVGWSMANHLRAELVLDALNMALRRRSPASGLIHHSDRGSQYASVRFGQRLEEAGLLPSMGSAADCFDNALMESFFATLKCELVHRGLFGSREEARTAIFEYIECFYNPVRRHSSLGYMSPVDYEGSTIAQTTAA
jgi:putative transposase